MSPEAPGSCCWRSSSDAVVCDARLPKRSAAAIQSGRLPAGTVLPSSRRLAVDLGVSRGVVTDAYDQLVSEGYLDVKPRFPPVVAAVAAGAAAGRRTVRAQMALRLQRDDAGRRPLPSPRLDPGRGARPADGARRCTRLRRPGRGRIELRIALSCLPGASARRASGPGSNRRHAGVRPCTRSALPRPVRKGRDHRRDGDAVASRAVGDRHAIRPPARRLSGRLRWPPHR